MIYYAYRMMTRTHQDNVILKCRRLFQQLAVDVYIKVETERLAFIRFDQAKLRSETIYTCVVQFIQMVMFRILAVWRFSHHLKSEDLHARIRSRRYDVRAKLGNSRFIYYVHLQSEVDGNWTWVGTGPKTARSPWHNRQSISAKTQGYDGCAY